MLKKIFSAKDLIKSIPQAIDEAILTKEERLNNFNELLEKYEPFKIAQRFLALIVTGVFLGLHVIFSACKLVVIFTTEKESVLIGISELQKEHNELLFYPFGIITAFYFSGGVINGALKRFSNKTQKK